MGALDLQILRHHRRRGLGGAGGFLGTQGGMGAVDFAGGIVVHISAGMSALAAVIVLGKRQGFPDGISPPHNLPIAVLGAAKLGSGGRRIAVLGDMLELGPESPRLHADLARPLIEAQVDAVFTCGANMRLLHEALPASMRSTS